jgi:hypothetical protein
MSIYLIAALVVALLTALATIVAATNPLRNRLVRVHLEIGEVNESESITVLTRLVPAGIAVILFKKVSRGAYLEERAARSYNDAI